jgi:hypothetical protein
VGGSYIARRVGGQDHVAHGVGVEEAEVGGLRPEVGKDAANATRSAKRAAQVRPVGVDFDPVIPGVGKVGLSEIGDGGLRTSRKYKKEQYTPASCRCLFDCSHYFEFKLHSSFLSRQESNEGNTLFNI